MAANDLSATKFLSSQLTNKSVCECVYNDEFTGAIQCSSKRVTLTMQRLDECIITSCRCACCFSLSGEWSCCRSFSSSCICHSLRWTVCFSISWSNAVSSRCTGSWGSLNTHTHQMRSGLISCKHQCKFKKNRHLLMCSFSPLSPSIFHLPTLLFFYIYSIHSFTRTSLDLLVFIHPINPSLLFPDAAFEIFLHLTASPLGVRLNLTTPTLLFLTQIPHLQTYTGKS